jgi:hypothetical protein
VDPLPDTTTATVYLEEGRGLWLEVGYDEGRGRHAQRHLVAVPVSGELVAPPGDGHGKPLVEFIDELSRAVEFLRSCLLNSRAYHHAVEVAGDPPPGKVVWFDEASGRWSEDSPPPGVTVVLDNGGGSDG